MHQVGSKSPQKLWKACFIPLSLPFPHIKWINQLCHQKVSYIFICHHSHYYLSPNHSLLVGLLQLDFLPSFWPSHNSLCSQHIIIFRKSGHVPPLFKILPCFFIVLECSTNSYRPYMVWPLLTFPTSFFTLLPISFLFFFHLFLLVGV